jgi:endonuclease/exonuclease/phosphatase (EEP) superfamily protein YafD
VTRRRAVALLVVVPWLVWATVRVLGLERDFVLVAAMALTPFAAATAWIPVAVALALRQWAVALAALAIAAVLVGVVAPRAFGGPQAGGTSVTVLSANLRYGRADAEALARLARARDADVLSVQELTPAAVPRLAVAGLLERYPHRILDPRAGARGSGILSRHPLSAARRSPGPAPAMPEAVVEVPGAVPLWLKAVHPVKPMFRNMWRWDRDMRALPGATPRGPLRMLAGDFNATLDHDEMRRLLDSGYVDAAETAGDGLRPTYRMIQIDHVLVDRRARIGAVTFDDLAGSDHDTITATVGLPQSENR